MQEHQTLPQQGQTSADGANASPIIELAKAAAPVLNHLAPGYYTTFLKAVPKLGKHMGNILLQYILASLQYPTVVQKNVDTFAALPAKITPARLKLACHNAMLSAHQSQCGPGMKQEVVIDDDQRMGTCTWLLARVMNEWGLLTPKPDTLPASEGVVMLGNNEYCLSYDKGRLESVCSKYAHITSPERLTNTSLVEYVATVKAAFTDRSPSRRRRCVKQRAPKGWDEKNNFVTYFIWMHVSWLISDRESKGLGKMDWKQMNLRTLQTFVPDPAEILLSLEDTGIGSADMLGSLMKQPPLLTTCFLSLLVPVLEMKHPSTFENPGTHARLIASVEEHTREFGIPPSLAWICKPEGKVALISQMAAPSMQAGQGTPSQAGRKKQNRRKSRKKQVPRAKWFQTLDPSRSGWDQCHCNGNCHIHCPARKPGKRCPNKATRKFITKPLCEACRCRTKGCSNAARRPFGQFLLPANYGYCQRHYPTRKKAKHIIRTNLGKTYRPRGCLPASGAT